MAAIQSPYGLRAVNHLGGTPYAGSTRMYPIASGLANNIYYGDVVAVRADGTIVQVQTTGAAAAPFSVGTVGVFVGVTFSDPISGNVTFRQNWPTGTVTPDAQAYVVDDPGAIFQIQANGSVGQLGLGANTMFAAAQATGTGNLLSGNSTSAASAAGAVAAPALNSLKVVGFVDSPTSTVGDAFTDLLVKFNPAAHAYTSNVSI